MRDSTESAEGEFVIQGELGLHARPAGRLASLLGRYRSEVLLARSDRTNEWVNGRSVLSVLSLAASQGTRLRVRATGADCQEALEALRRFLEEAGEAPTGI